MVLFSCLIRATLSATIFGLFYPPSTHAQANNYTNETYSNGVGKLFYPCTRNQSVCKQKFECWKNPTRGYRTKVWTCPIEDHDGCSCQRIFKTSIICKMVNVIPEEVDLPPTRRTDKLLKRTETTVLQSTKTTNASIIEKIETELLESECPFGTRCARLKQRRDIPSLKECVHCNVQVPGMTYVSDDEDNCIGENTKNDSFPVPQPCTPMNASDACKDDTECLSFEIEPNSNLHFLRRCTTWTVKSSPLGCFCTKPNGFSYGDSCEKSSDCQDGERCAKLLFYDEFTCVSCQAGSSVLEFVVDDGKEHCRPPCIAVEALNGLKEDDLVFSKHIRAAVLCDADGNCATPGHIVMHKSTPMMMKSYCGLPTIECRYKIKFVNSPRMKIGIRIPSLSDDLIYTALAAKHESLMEEYFLSAIVRAQF